jgi:hypothetical protein
MFFLFAILVGTALLAGYYRSQLLIYQKLYGKLKTDYAAQQQSLEAYQAASNSATQLRK